MHTLCHVLCVVSPWWLAAGSLLAMALSAPCNWVHPAVMYGHFGTDERTDTLTHTTGPFMGYTYVLVCVCACVCCAAEWDGKPFPRSKVPLFYHDITQDTADMLERLDDEYQQLKTQLEQVGA